MRFRAIVGFSCILLGLATPLPTGPAARAAPVTVRTSYVHFPLRAGSEAGLLAEMRRAGPLVGGRHAFARTRMRAAISSSMAGPAGRCRMRKVSMRLRFSIMLPRPLHLRRMSAPARRRWAAFASRLKRHELHHCSIWLACVRKARRAMLKLAAPSCAALKRRAELTYHRIMDACGKRHDIFDRRERMAVLRDPFVRAALGLDRKSGKRRKGKRR